MTPEASHEDRACSKCRCYFRTADEAQEHEAFVEHPHPGSCFVGPLTETPSPQPWTRAWCEAVHDGTITPAPEPPLAEGTVLRTLREVRVALGGHAYLGPGIIDAIERLTRLEAEVEGNTLRRIIEKACITFAEGPNQSEHLTATTEYAANLYNSEIRRELGMPQ